MRIRREVKANGPCQTVSLTHAREKGGLWDELGRRQVVPDGGTAPASIGTAAEAGAVGAADSAIVVTIVASAGAAATGAAVEAEVSAGIIGATADEGSILGDWPARAGATIGSGRRRFASGSPATAAAAAAAASSSALAAVASGKTFKPGVGGTLAATGSSRGRLAETSVVAAGSCAMVADAGWAEGTAGASISLSGSCCMVTLSEAAGSWTFSRVAPSFSATASALVAAASASAAASSAAAAAG